MDYIKRFFGLIDKNHNNKSYQQDDGENVESNRFPNSNNVQKPTFHVFSDPLQMQQYFEHQLNEMLKLFGVQEFDNGFFSNFYSGTLDGQEASEFSDRNNSKDLRDQFLKNGYEKPSQKYFEKADKDIDERVQLGDLDSIFGRSNNRNPHENVPDGFFFGQSQSIKTIRNPDGSIETHRTIKDNEGNEEITICRKMGDKEYCICKKRDKYGKEEIIENLVNIDDKEKNTLFIAGDKFPNEDIPKEPQRGFPFDFFK